MDLDALDRLLKEIVADQQQGIVAPGNIRRAIEAVPQLLALVRKLLEVMERSEFGTYSISDRLRVTCLGDHLWFVEKDAAIVEHPGHPTLLAALERAWELEGR